MKRHTPSRRTRSWLASSRPCLRLLLNPLRSRVAENRALTFAAKCATVHPYKHAITTGSVRTWNNAPGLTMRAGENHHALKSFANDVAPYARKRDETVPRTAQNPGGGILRSTDETRGIHNAPRAIFLPQAVSK